jgi:hypothetical protein
MKSQWDCLLENLGEWRGSFTRLSPQGTVLGDTPTVVSLEGLNQNQTIRQRVCRYSSEVNTQELPSLAAIAPIDEKVLEYSSVGRGVLFCETGAFSQGSMQYGPFSEFGAELGLIEGDRRLRLVQLFNPQGALDQLTLIREQRAGSNAPERQALQVSDLIGTWQGEAISVFPDWYSTQTSTTLKIWQEGEGRLHQELRFEGSPAIASTATINGSILTFDQSHPAVQVLLLPDGASSTSPLKIPSQTPFFLEVGWLLQPTLRQRLIRRYNAKGEWVSLTLVIERKVAAI